jgi:hypothetical protein
MSAIDRRGFLTNVAAGLAARGDPASQVTDQPVQALTLVPSGGTNIRITEFPRVLDA